jgi:hypothetical protein
MKIFNKLLEKIKKIERDKERERILKEGYALVDKYNGTYSSTALREFLNSLQS